MPASVLLVGVLPHPVIGRNEFSGAWKDDHAARTLNPRLGPAPSFAFPSLVLGYERREPSYKERSESSLLRLPVTLEIAGSNPFGSAARLL